MITVDCKEKGKIVSHSVELLSMTIDNLKLFWERSKVYPTLFGIKATQDFGEFCSIFLHYDSSGKCEGNGLVWVVDDFKGVFYMTDICVPEDATVHFSFFDGRINGRVPLVKEMLKHVFDKYDFRRLSAIVPMYAVIKGYENSTKNPLECGIFKFVQDCGFKIEGRKRKCALYKDDYFDAILFGILREEVLNGI